MGTPKIANLGKIATSRGEKINGNGLTDRRTKTKIRIKTKILTAKFGTKKIGTKNKLGTKTQMRTKTNMWTKPKWGQN